MISGSIVQMLSSSNLIYTALLSVFFLKKKFFRHHNLAIGAIILGMCLVGLSFILSGKGGSSHEHSSLDIIIGLICL
jgi:drug/metabolite transporter (DMT)-like permease